jgi:hypothetical protein
MLLNELYQPMLSHVPEGDIHGLVMASMKVMTAQIWATGAGTAHTVSLDYT